MNLFDNYSVTIKKPQKTVFSNENDIFQDGTTAVYRAADGKLWAMSGHTHLGHIAMFCGTCMSDLKELYPIKTAFKTGNAGIAFDCVKYPDGVLPRGSIWPMGLFVHPITGRFYCFFHNETGWGASGTAYDSFGLCEKPLYDSDFRHIGLMYSDDEGKNWFFDRWVLTGNKICFTEVYNPGCTNTIGQKGDIINLGSGDFSTYVDRENGYIYILYNMLEVNIKSGVFCSCNVYCARAEILDNGLIGGFVKFYNGSFCSSGDMGRESAVLKNVWHARAVYLKDEGFYLMSGVKFVPGKRDVSEAFTDTAVFYTSPDGRDWSEPRELEFEGKPFGNHYVSVLSDDKTLPENILSGKKLFYLNHNGTDVLSYEFNLEKKA